MYFEPQTFTDTVFLSDFAESASSHKSTANHRAGNTTNLIALPRVMHFDRCRFDGPVFATRPGKRAFGGQLSFTDASMAAGLNLRELALSADLDLHGTMVAGLADLSQMRVSRIEMAGATFSGDVNLANSTVLDLSAVRTSFEGKLLAQRLRVLGDLSLIEARVAGYLDLSYARILGDAYFDHCKSQERVVLDYADIHGLSSFFSVVWPRPSLRFGRLRGKIDAFEQLALSDEKAEGLRRDL